MRYLGGKFRSSKAIAEIVNQHQNEGNVYIEPFMGSCWVTRLINYKFRLAGDLHEELVCLFQKLQDGWEPPEEISAELYADIRSNKTNGKYPKELVAFAGFGCAYAGSYFRKYAGPDYAARTKRSLLKKIKLLSDVRFFTLDYYLLHPRGAVIYCDPPYSDSYGFRITGTRGNGSFDSEEFWEKMRKWSEHNIVYISEHSAPEDFECVKEIPVRAGVRTLKGNEIRIERLFRKPGNVTLVKAEKQEDCLAVLFAPDPI